MDIGRRKWLGLASGLAASVSVRTASAQSPKRVGVIGVEAGGTYSDWKKAFPDEFARQGFVEGRNLHLLWFDVAASGPNGPLDYAQLREGGRRKAAEMAAARLDCMIANGEPHTRFLQEASRAIPTVVDVPDPVGLEFAKSLARPGGNVTGLHDGREEVSIKTAELFKRLVPKLSCIAWIGAENFRRSGNALEAAAKSIGLRFHAIGIRDESASEADRIGREMASMRRQGCLAAEVGLAGDLFDSIVRHAVTNRIALSGGRSGRGVLFSLWTERLPEEESTRRIPAIAARVLRGERPADIPFEGPSRYFLTLNLQVAAQVGVTVPDEVVLLANRVIR